MTVEELASKYAGAYASDFELPDTPSSSEPEDALSDEDNTDMDEGSSGDGETSPLPINSVFACHPLCPG